MMTREDRQEALSLAYVKAVAAVSGMTYSTRSRDYGIDLDLHEVDQVHGRYVETGVNLELQVKSTTSALETRTAIMYDLDVRAYDLLRFESLQRRVLVLLVLPPDEATWVRQTGTKLELRKGLYWLSLRSRAAVPNRSVVRVRIPRRQAFTPDALRWIMDRIRAREALP